MNKKECLDIFERYILRKASQEEVESLHLYINQDQQLNNWLEQQIVNTSDQIDAEVKLRMLENIRSNINLPNSTSNEQKKKTLSLRWLFRIAAIMLLPILSAITVYLIMQPQGAEPLIVVVEPGEKANVVLPDGSKVSLNSDSRLTYYNDYNEKERYLKLDGEAYFEVEPNTKKPFIVECVDMKVEVLGTTFGIKAYDNDEIISTVLNIGKIQIQTPDKTLILKPNERVVYDRKAKHTQSATVNAADYTDWRHNRLRFDNESLQDIATTISRIHNVDIIFEEAHIKNLKFTGTIDNTNIETVLNTLSFTSPINYKIKDSAIILYEDKQSKMHFNN